MKKILLFILFIPFISFSQFNYGVKGSFILANLKIEKLPFNDTKIKPSYSLGAFIEYNFQPIALELSVNFTDAGAKGDRDIFVNGLENPTQRFEHTYNIKTIFIELLGKYYITEKINVKVGPYMGIITSAEYATEEGKNSDMKDIYDLRSDFGLAFGAEYFIYKGLFVEAKYSFGLVDLIKYSNDYISRMQENQPVNLVFNQPTFKNRIISIGAGYKFN